MLNVWIYTIISVLIVSLASLIGIIFFAWKEKKLTNILIFLVSFSAGALIAGALVHLLPEAVEEHGFTLQVSISVLAGILAFFILEQFVHWRHCHVPTSKKHPHPLAIMNLVGDGFHNLIDGMVIAGSYMVSVHLGVTTTLAVLLHEIPQEIGDFGVLLYAGLKKTKALFFNFLSASVSIIGAVLTLFLGAKIPGFTSFLIPFTAGGFIYIAGTDLMPELHKRCEIWEESILHLLALVLGIIVMMLLLLLE